LTYLYHRFKQYATKIKKYLTKRYVTKEFETDLFETKKYETKLYETSIQIIKLKNMIKSEFHMIPLKIIVLII